MTVERVCAGRCWEVSREGDLLRIGGLELDLGEGNLEGRLVVYADPEGRPTLEPTDWLGAEVLLPPRPLKAVQVGEVVYGDEGNEQREPVYELRPGPLNWELVRVRLFGLPPAANGGEA